MSGEQTDTGGALKIGVSQSTEINQLSISPVIRHGAKTDNNHQGLYLAGIEFTGTRTTADFGYQFYPSFTVHYGENDYFAIMKRPTGTYLTQKGTEVYKGSVTVPARVLNKYDSFESVTMTGTRSTGNMMNRGHGHIIYHLPLKTVIKPTRPQ